MMSIQVGEVVAVHGQKIVIKIFHDSNLDTLYYKGRRYKGVSIYEHISIQRGFRDIVCRIEGEYLNEGVAEQYGSRMNYIRKIEAKPLGYFESGVFIEGIKFLPLIKDPAFLLDEDTVYEMYNKGEDDSFIIGNTFKEDIPVPLPWRKLFSSHIAIFGNTGSGKSNTLAKLYSVLLDQKKVEVQKTSKFIIIDFNGEYTQEQLVAGKDKMVVRLGDSTSEIRSKLQLVQSEFWNTETLCILFQATVATQRPFINRVISGRDKYGGNLESFLKYIKSTIRKVFTTPETKSETLNLLKRVTTLLKLPAVGKKLDLVSWNATTKSYFVRDRNANRTQYFGADGAVYSELMETDVNGINLSTVSPFDELVARFLLNLTNNLVYGYSQFDHIQPVISRAEAILSQLESVMEVVDEPNLSKFVTVFSFRNCSQEIKNVLPLLIAKLRYRDHKQYATYPPQCTMHLIIDEAHNILSQQSSDGQEAWKDYRLELFEEIVKEGRKFGVFLTLSSQRPADISPTIVSQIHNFFIHRLVNDKDLKLLDNTISTLDSVSKGMIPNLSKGGCIITGTSFDLPILLQMDQVSRIRRPDSEDIDLEALWK